jgi:hypothetical protein
MRSLQRNVVTLGSVIGGLLGIVAAGVMAVSAFAVEDELTLKDAMGKDLKGLQRILIGLTDSEYQGAPENVGLLQEHAAQLTLEIPESVTTNRDQFLSYAFNLAGNSQNLKSTVELLIQHDRHREGECPPRVSTDYLRDVAAA